MASESKIDAIENMTQHQLEQYFDTIDNDAQTNIFKSILPKNYSKYQLQFVLFFNTLDIANKCDVIYLLLHKRKYILSRDKRYIVFEDECMETSSESDSDNNDYIYHTTKLYDINDKSKLLDTTTKHIRKPSNPRCIYDFKMNRNITIDRTNQK